MKKAKVDSKNENLTDILKLLTTRIEEATVDIHAMKGRMGMMELKLNTVDMNTKVIKSDVEKLRGEVREVKGEVEEIKGEVGEVKEGLKASENRLNARLTHVADLITISLGRQHKTLKKRVARIEHTQQAL